MAAEGKCKLKRKTIKKRKSFFMATLKLDAEEYYKEKIKLICDKIKNERVKVERCNNGFAFISF